MPANDATKPLDPRYAPQARLQFVGPEGQRRLGRSHVAIVGVGATGGAIAESLARAGVGSLRLIDRDVPERSNLHRQVLYDEEVVARGLQKVEAARLRLQRVNSGVVVEPRVARLDRTNALDLLSGVDLVLDGTDDFAPRFVINDACAKLGIPWVYTGVVGTVIHGFPIVPGETACFRCYLGSVPPHGTFETSDTAGVLGPAVLVGAGLAATEGIKLLLGLQEEVAGGLTMIDAWTRESRRVVIPPDPDCSTCRGTYCLDETSNGTELTESGR